MSSQTFHVTAWAEYDRGGHFPAVAEPALLAELAADPRIRRYLLARLSDTVALVDPGHAGDVERALLEAGHTPKVLTGDLE